MPHLYRSLSDSGLRFRLRARGFWLAIALLAICWSFGQQATAQSRHEKILNHWETLLPDSAAPLLEKFLKQANLSAEVRCRALILASETNSRVNDFERAEHYAQQAVTLAQSQAHHYEPWAIRRLAKVYQSKRQFAQGQQLLQQALTLFEEQGNQTEAINTNLDLIEFYRAGANPFMAWKLYQHLKPGLQEGKFTPYQAARLLHRAAAASIEGSINDSVEALSQLSLAISEKHGFTDHMATSYNELGHYYRQQKQFDLSLNYLQQAEKLQAELGNKQDLLFVLRNQVMLFTKMGELDKAEAVLARLRDFPQKPVLYKNTTEYAVLESTIYRLRGDYKKAFEAMERALKLQKAIHTEMYNKEFAELTTKYRTALAEQRFLEEQQTALVASELALKHRMQRNAAIIIVAVALAFVALIGIAYRNNQKKKKLLEEQNTAIDQINKLLSESLSVQESLYSELQHRVKNNLSVLSSLLYLQSNKSTGLVKQALSQTQSRVEALAMLHRQLLSKGKIQEKVKLVDYVSNLFHHLQATFKQEGVDITYSLNCADVNLPASLVTSVGLSLNELITNSYKYAFANRHEGEILLSCTAGNDLLHVLYRDSGSGIPDDKLIANSENLGMNIIKLLVRQHKGNFHYFRENNYSCFELFFTIDKPAIPHLHEQVADN